MCFDRRQSFEKYFRVFQQNTENAPTIVPRVTIEYGFFISGPPSATMKTFYGKRSLNVYRPMWCRVLQKNMIGRGFKTKSFANCTCILKVDFRRAIPVKYFPTMSYDFKTGT